MPEDIRRPSLGPEIVFWRWYERLERARIYATEFVPAGLSVVPVSKPVALDRSAWWPVIAAEGWCPRTAMTLLQRVENALFLPLTEPETDDGESE